MIEKVYLVWKYGAYLYTENPSTSNIFLANIHYSEGGNPVVIGNEETRYRHHQRQGQ